MHLLVPSPYQISLMDGNELFKILRLVCITKHLTWIKFQLCKVNRHIQSNKLSAAIPEHYSLAAHSICSI